jgi:hypothetical protein
MEFTLGCIINLLVVNYLQRMKQSYNTSWGIWLDNKASNLIMLGAALKLCLTE